MRGVAAAAWAVGVGFACALACAGQSRESSTAPDRSAELEQRIARIEAHLGINDAGADRSANFEQNAGSPADLADPLFTRCLSELERRCRPSDQECLRGGESDCARQALRRRLRAVARRLDAQLTPERIDQAFSALATERVRREHQLKPSEVVQIVCTADFCRITASPELADGGWRSGRFLWPMGAFDGSDGGPPAQSIHAEDGAVYVARGSYRFPI